jgi:hypothetical protein
MVILQNGWFEVKIPLNIVRYENDLEALNQLKYRPKDSVMITGALFG